MKGHGEKLTRCRERAIAALLTKPTREAAAKEAGVSPATLWRWLQDDAFRSEYERARMQLVDDAVASLQRACVQAVKTLVAIAADRDATPAARVAAARAILDQAYRGVEFLDLAERIDRMELVAGIGECKP